MCGRVTLPTSDEMHALASNLQAHGINATLDNQLELPWGKQARPGEILPAFIGASHLSSSEQADGLRSLVLSPFIWGYTLPKSSKLVYNSRIENAHRPMWTDSFAQRRAIVAVSSFFEPHHAETERHPLTRRIVKKSFEFCSPMHTPLLLGAIYQNDRISIVTTEPNSYVAPIHQRMPLVLSFEEVPTWLGSDWAQLDDRTGFELESKPEHKSPAPPAQATLF